MKEINYKNLIQKSLADKLEGEEQLFLNKWLSESEKNKVVMENMRFLWETTSKYKPSDFKPDANLAFKKFQSKISDELQQETTAKVISLRHMYKYLSVAASILLVCGFFFLMPNASVDYNGLQYTSINSSLEILPDGTKVWLDQGTKLYLSKNFGNTNREVKIDGKAFFDVQRNESIPFNVEMGNAKLSVLGTSFNIDNTNDNVRVDVRSGKVKVSNKNEERVLVLNEAVLISEEQISTEKYSPANVDWINFAMKFDNEPISEVIKEFELTYNVSIKTSSNVDLSCKITSPNLGATNLEDVFNIFSELYEMEYEKSTDDIYKIKYLNCK